MGGKWLRVWRTAVKFVSDFNYINTCRHCPVRSRPLGNMETKFKIMTVVICFRSCSLTTAAKKLLNK